MSEGLGIQIIDHAVCLVEDISRVDPKNPSIYLFSGLMELEQLDQNKKFNLLHYPVDLKPDIHRALAFSELSQFVKSKRNSQGDFYISVVGGIN